MKKMLIIAGIAAAALLASCAKETASDNTSFSDSIRLDLKVPDLKDPLTKAVKTGWVSGDVIDIWFDGNTQKTPDLVAKYDGSAWGVDALATVSGNTPAASGKLNAIYFSAANQDDYDYDGVSVTVPSRSGDIDGQTVFPVSDLVAYSQKMDYTFSESTLSSSLNSWEFLANTQVVVASDDISSSDWYMKCDGLRAVTGFSLADDGIAPVTSDLGAYVLGQTNGDGVAFYFAADSDAGKDYRFTIAEVSSSDKFSYKAASKTLAADNSSRNAVKIAKTKFGVDYYQNYLDGKDLVIGDKTVNKTNFPAYTLVSSDITVADLQTIINTNGLVFIENGVSIKQNGGKTTLILKKETALVGRMDNGVQPEINFGAYNFNTVYDLVLKNICLTSKVSTGPIQNSSMTTDRSVYVEDCTISCLNYVVLDRATGADYAKLYFNNNIIQYSSTQTAGMMYTYANKTTDGAGCLAYTFTNNVMHYDGTPGTGTVYTFRMDAKGGGAYYTMGNLVFTFSHNTIHDICPSYLIRIGSFKQLLFNDNVWEGALGGTSCNLLQILNTNSTVLPSPTVDPVSSATNNWFYANNYDGVAGSHPYRFGNYPTDYITATGWNLSWQGQSGATSLLGEVNTDTRYFPVNPSKNMGGAGATYGTKKWVLRDWKVNPRDDS